MPFTLRLISIPGCIHLTVDFTYAVYVGGRYPRYGFALLPRYVTWPAFTHADYRLRWTIYVAGVPLVWFTVRITFNVDSVATRCTRLRCGRPGYIYPLPVITATHGYGYLRLLLYSRLVYLVTIHTLLRLLILPLLICWIVPLLVGWLTFTDRVTFHDVYLLRCYVGCVGYPTFTRRYITVVVVYIFTPVDYLQ